MGVALDPGVPQLEHKAVPDKQAGGQRALPQDVLPVALAHPLKAEGHFLAFAAKVDKVEGDTLTH